MSEPYAYVRYSADRVEESVPCSFIKNFDTIEGCIVNQECWVFRNFGSADTPAKISRREGFVAELDVDTSRTSGFYKGVILLLADSDHELKELLKCKRIRKPTHKVLSQGSVPKRKPPEKQESKVQKNKRECKKVNCRKQPQPADTASMESQSILEYNAQLFYNSEEEDYDRPADTEERKVESRKRRNLLEKLPNTARELAERVFEVADASFSDSDTGSDFGPTDTLKEEIAMLKQQISNRDKKIAKLEKIVINKDEASEALSEKNFALEKENHHVANGGSNGNEPPQNKEPDYELSEAALNLIEMDVNKPGAAGEPPQPPQNQEPDYKLSEAALNLIEMDVNKPGAAGDSLFVKAVAKNVYGVETLANSSLTGKPPVWDKHATPKPKLCEKKLNYIRETLSERIDREVPAVTQEVKRARLRKINLYIREKIGSTAAAQKPRRTN